jgi:signal transduction histidine kinase
VLLNLCVNARDAMPNGGTLLLSAENITIDEHYAGMMPEAHAGPYVVLQVSDTGTGIPRDVLDKIFDPFFTTKEMGKGTGLGLSSLIGIVKSHGGFVNVYSEVGTGTTFKVFLPALPGCEATPAIATPVPLPLGRGELILVVDDELTLRDITQRILERRGYRILTAADGP